MKMIKIVKITIAAAIIIPAIGAAIYYSMTSVRIPFESVCTEGHAKYTKYCENVGKRAHSTKRMLAVNDTDYGEIMGVAWRQRGSIISSSGQEMRYSDSNSYYYIIGTDKKDYFFIRIVNEIDPK